MTIDLELKPVTFSRTERLCHVQGVVLDRVLNDTESLTIYAGTGPAVLDIVAPGHEVPAEEIDTVGRQAARLWMRLCMQHVHVASMRATRYAEQCGVKEVMDGMGTGGKPIHRHVSTFDPAHYDRIWHDWKVSRAMTYLLIRSVDHVSENLEEYI